MQIEKQKEDEGKPAKPTTLQAVPSQVLKEILEWASQLPLWQQEALRRLFKLTDLDATSKEEIFEQACIELNLKPGQLNCKPLEAKDLPIAKTTKNTWLTGLKSLEGVNAIKPDQQLPIGKSLNVVYGDNGTGKSGYARVLKKACRTRAAEPILGNVFKQLDTETRARATFQYESDGNEFEDRWIDGADSPSWLGRYAVFDSNCCRVYVTDKTEPQLVPFGLDVLPRLASIVEYVKERLIEKASIEATSIEALKGSIENNTAVGKMLTSLTE